MDLAWVTGFDPRPNLLMAITLASVVWVLARFVRHRIHAGARAPRVSGQPLGQQQPTGERRGLCQRDVIAVLAVALAAALVAWILDEIGMPFLLPRSLTNL